VVEQPPPEAGPPPAEAVVGCRFMYHVYVLKSLKNGKRYVGYTSKDPDVRFVEHVSGTNAWTRQNRPLALVYSEKFENVSDARLRERFLKCGQGRKFLDGILNK
jgi:predicted GIY-YIG superfamily endonuclease